MHRWKMILLTLLLVVLAAPLSAYTIYLKDGTRIVAKGTYRVDEDGKAIITLQNGTQTFIKSSEIDVERTLRSNREGYGTALLLEEGKVVERPIVSEELEDDNLVDLAARTDTSTRARPQVRRPMRHESADRKVTQAGFIDLSSVARRPYPNLEIATEIQRIFRAQGVEGLQIHQGTSPGRPFLELGTNSEASVFRALEASADALLHVRSQFPGTIDSFEMYLLTSSRDRAGQFLITEDAATALADNVVDTSVFFVRQVQF